MQYDTCLQIEYCSRTWWRKFRFIWCKLGMQIGIYCFSDMFLKFLAYNLSKKASFVAHHGTLIASAHSGAQSSQECRLAAAFRRIHIHGQKQSDNEKNKTTGCRNFQSWPSLWREYRNTDFRLTFRIKNMARSYQKICYPCICRVENDF